MKLMRPAWVLGVTLLAPLAAWAAATAQQEIADALRARPHLDRGADTFETCASCHGMSGTGTVDGDIPNIAGQHFQVIVKQLVEFQHGKRWDIRMSHFADQHHLTSAQAIADVAAYVSSLPQPDWAKAGTGSGTLLGHGEAIYGERCASCHGRAGQGNAKDSVPRLAGQHFEYLRRQIYNGIDGERPGFTTSHVRLLAHLQHDDIEGVTDYLSRLPAGRPVERSASGPGGSGPP